VRHELARDRIARVIAIDQPHHVRRDGNHIASRDRIERFEYEHAAKFLGADVEYGGRPLDVAHAPHPIRGGHFERRKEILRQTLVRHAVPEPIARAWLAHTESLRALVTKDAGSDCDD
jgi:truncated hemoglobin YjbI